MFDKFGEFDSAEEINRAAAAQLKEGDLDAIKTIAEENGLDPEDAEDFCTGAIDSLTTPLLAAIGKLEMESKDLELKNMMEDWKNFLIQMCEESDQMAQAVRKKGKSLEKCMAQILKVSFETKTQLDDRIVRAAGLKPPIYLGIPGKAQIRKIAEKYDADFVAASEYARPSSADREHLNEFGHRKLAEAIYNQFYSKIREAV